MYLINRCSFIISNFLSNFIIILMVNLVKLCVGITSINQLEQLQSMRRGEYIKAGRFPLNIHITRNKPKRFIEIIDSGSLYWVIASIDT